jgi:hypothetical protein
VRVVVGEVVGDAGGAAVQQPPPRSSADTTSPVAAFTSGGPPRKIVPWSRTMTASSAIGRHVRAAGGAAAEDRGDLRDAAGAHRRLVEEDAAEVLAVGEDLVLARQEGARRSRRGRRTAGGCAAPPPAPAGAS